MSAPEEHLSIQHGRGKRVLDGEYDYETWRAGSIVALERALGADNALLDDFREATATASSNVILTPDGYVDLLRQAATQRGLQLLAAAQAAGTSTGPTSSTIDRALFDHVAHLIVEERWHQVAASTCVFLEDVVRTAAGLTAEDHGKNLMVSAFKTDEGPLKCGSTRSEELGWQQLATGFVQAISNVDRHRIQKRDDARTYAMGVVGTASLILTQLRHQHGTRFRGSITRQSAETDE